MDKILNLLKESGVKSELADKIGQALDGFKTQVREQLEVEYKSKLDAAKQVCVEETEAHKAELARRLSIFCETKVAAIDAALQKQSAIRESEALAKLRELRSLLEGVQPNGRPNNGNSEAIKKLEAKLAAVNEEKQQAIAQANRQIAIAEKALKRNRELSMQMRQTVSEDRKPAQDRVTQRQPARPQTTRRALTENQTRQAPPQRTTPAVVDQTGGRTGGTSIDDIASHMEELL